MQVDAAFKEYFSGRLRQVFLYITDVCGLRCEQCLYKTTLANREMDLQSTLALVRLFREYGAAKLTFIGGEPTLYGYKQKNQPLFEVIEVARGLGYEYIRLDTNGQGNHTILDNLSFRKLDNLSFSLDGHTSEINDTLRGRGTFARCTEMIRKATSLGYYVSITSCVHPGNLDYIDEMIEFVTALGASEFNMHPLFKMGIDRDTFTGNTNIDPHAWVDVYNKIRVKIDEGQYPIPVRLPQRFVRTTEYLLDPEAYDYCPVRMGERVLVHPNGEIRICALCIGSPYHIATYNRDEIRFGAPQSEISSERLKRLPCMSQVANFGDLTPLCISYKPHQNEYVWTTGQVDSRLFDRTHQEPLPREASLSEELIAPSAESWQALHFLGANSRV
jgi:MoaA/NifB/PqqE/SkfB family radical SAM enzyme